MSFRPWQWKSALSALGLLGLCALTGCGASLTEKSSDVDAGAPSLSAQQEQERQRALDAYHEAWRTVTRDYLDPTFNGQAPERWKHWRTRYDDALRAPADAYVAIDAMLATLGDDYTRFLPPREMSDQSMEIDSRVFGVGIQIALREGRVTVMGVLPNGPAAAAGLEARDVIDAIDGVSARTITLEEAADRIRGPQGTPVRLTLQRPEGASRVKTLVKTLRRAEVSIQSAFIKPLAQNPDIGYIRLNSFISEKADDEMRAALKQLRGKRALILDLRHNYGGLLSNAVSIADLFLKDGVIVSIVGRRHRPVRVESARDDGEQDVMTPLAILIDGGSASASEILSGALQDHHRAMLVGERSFGKGLVQKIEPLSGGAGLNITISKYLTPNGVDINHKGISPDITIPLTIDDLRAGRDPQLQGAITALRRQLATQAPRAPHKKAS